MSYEENYQHMIRRNKATGYAIYDCLLKAYRKHAESMDISGITDRDISRISKKLFVSERWIRHILCKYHLFFISSTSIIRKRNGKMKKRKFDRLKSVIFSDMEGVTDFWCIELI